MNFYCPNCKAYYTQPDEQIPVSGLTVRCLDCGTLIALQQPAGRRPGPPVAAGAVVGALEPLAHQEATVTAGPPRPEPQGALPGAEGRGPGGALSPVTARVVVDLGSLASSSDVFPRDQELTVPVVGPASSSDPILLAMPSGPARSGRDEPVPALVAVALPAGAGASAAAGGGSAAPASGGPEPTTTAMPPLTPSRAQSVWRPADTWLALRCAWQPRRTVQAASALFVALCVVSFLCWLGAQSDVPALGVVSAVVALALAWAALTLTAGSLTATLHRELCSARRGELLDGLRWTAGHLGSVLFTPLVAVGMALALLLGVALLHLPGRLPGVGEALYGLAFGPSLVLSCGAVLLLLLDLPILFFYLPLLQLEDRGPGAAVRLLLSLLARRGAAALGLMLLSAAVGAGLLVVLLVAGAAGFGITVVMGLGLLGPSVAELVGRLPPPASLLLLPLLPLLHLAQVAPPPPPTAGLELGAVLLLASTLGWATLLLTIFLAYVCGAGLVSFYVMTGRTRGETR